MTRKGIFLLCIKQNFTFVFSSSSYSSSYSGCWGISKEVDFFEHRYGRLVGT